MHSAELLSGIRKTVGEDHAILRDLLGIGQEVPG